jgi:hypothetical protein
MLKPTNAWRKFGSLIHQDFMLDCPDLYSGMEATYAGLTRAEQEEVYAILVKLNADECLTGELKRMWRQSGASYATNKPKLFFAEMLRSVEKVRSLRSGTER